MTSRCKVIGSFEGEYRWLSNFFPCLVKLDGEGYPTVEHAYQAAKTRCPSERRRIQQAPTATEAKHLGRMVRLPDDWDENKIGVMLDLLRQKFRDPVLQDALLGTGEMELIEGNTWGDRFWGVVRGTGRNELGRLLMQVRREIRDNAN
jgi:N-glycosidase YbiA